MPFAMPRAPLMYAYPGRCDQGVSQVGGESALADGRGGGQGEHACHEHRGEREAPRHKRYAATYLVCIERGYLMNGPDR